MAKLLCLTNNSELCEHAVLTVDSALAKKFLTFREAFLRVKPMPMLQTIYCIEVWGSWCEWGCVTNYIGTGDWEVDTPPHVLQVQHGNRCVELETVKISNDGLVFSAACKHDMRYFETAVLPWAVIRNLADDRETGLTVAEYDDSDDADDDEMVCAECGSEDLDYVNRVANGIIWRCKACKHETLGPDDDDDEDEDDD